MPDQDPSGEVKDPQEVKNPQIEKIKEIFEKLNSDLVIGINNLKGLSDPTVRTGRLEDLRNLLHSAQLTCKAAMLKSGGSNELLGDFHDFLSSIRELMKELMGQISISETNARNNSEEG